MESKTQRAAKYSSRKLFPSIACLLLATAGLSGLASITPLSSSTMTWQGGQAGAETSWLVAGNWQNGNLPGPDDSAYINKTSPAPVISGDVSVRYIYVGDPNTGSLTLDHGKLASRDLVVGNPQGSHGMVTLRNSTVEQFFGNQYHNSFIVGVEGSGVGIIENSTVETGWLVTASGHGQGKLTVKDSILNIAHEFTTASDGIGELDVQDSKIKARSIIAAYGALGNGAVKITNCTADLREVFNAGRNGTGTIDVFNSTITTNRLIAGFLTGSKGKLMVKDSTITVAADFSSGDMGEGQTVVDNSNITAQTVKTNWGRITAKNNAVITAADGIVVGDLAHDGILNIGAGPEEAAALPGTFNGNIVLGNTSGSSGTLNFNHLAKSYRFASPIASGAGTSAVNLYQGITTFSANNTYNGPTTVYGGELNLTGSLANSAISVRSGGRLSGTGSMKSLSTAGFTAPGSATAIGRLTIADSLTFAASHVYQCKISPQTAGSLNKSDMIAVGQTANLDGIVSISTMGGHYKVNKPYRYKIVSAGQQITGSFAQVIHPSRHYSFTVNKKGNDVFLTLVNRGAGSFIRKGAALSVASAFEQIKDRNGELAQVYEKLGSLSPKKAEAALHTLTPASAKAARQAISGHGFNSSVAGISRARNAIALPTNTSNAALQNLVNQLNTPVKSMFSQMPSLPSSISRTKNPGASLISTKSSLPENLNMNLGKASLWIDGTGQRFNSRHHRRPGTFVSGVKAATAGTQAGADYQISDRTKMGVMAGYSNTVYNNLDNKGDGKVDSYTAGAYSSYGITQNWLLDSALSYGRGHVKGRRQLSIAGWEKTARQHHYTNSYTGMLETSYRIKMQQNVTAKPYIGAGVLLLDERGYHETNAGNLGLHVKGKVRRHFQSQAGLQLSKTLATDTAQYGAFLRAGTTYRTLLGHSHHVRSTFLGQAPSFTVATGRRSSVAFAPGAGIAVELHNGVSCNLAYEGSLNRDQKSHAFFAKFSKRF